MVKLVMVYLVWTRVGVSCSFIFKEVNFMSKLIEICREIGEPIIEREGYVLVDIEYVKEGPNRVLRYMIDRPEGVDIDDCATISEAISIVLDEQDPIKNEYVLEVTSPGAERPLKTKEAVKQAIGSYVNVRMYAKIDGLKEVEGHLMKFEDDIVTIEYKDKTRTKTIDIPYDKISRIRLAIQF